MNTASTTRAEVASDGKDGISDVDVDCNSGVKTSDGETGATSDGDCVDRSRNATRDHRKD